MKNLNTQQIESLKKIIEKEFPLQGLSFNTPYEMMSQGIQYLVLERYSFNFKITYVVVPLKKDEQFNKLQELESIARDLCTKRDVNFGFFGTCLIKGDEVIALIPADHQIERLK